jgi:hypothetical protein
MAITYEPIATQTLGSATATVTFSSIPGTYTDLILIALGASTGGSDVFCQFNGDTGTNYSWTRLSGNGSTAASSRSSSASNIRLTIAGYPDTNAALMLASIQNYSNTTTYKTLINRANQATQGVDAIVGLWRSTSAITSIDVKTTPNTFNTGSTFTLYGIASA